MRGYLELIRKRLNLSDRRFEQMAALFSLAWGPTQAAEKRLALRSNRLITQIQSFTDKLLVRPGVVPPN